MLHLDLQKNITWFQKFTNLQPEVKLTTSQPEDTTEKGPGQKQQQADPTSSQAAEIQIPVPPQQVEKPHPTFKDLLLTISLIQYNL